MAIEKKISDLLESAASARKKTTKAKAPIRGLKKYRDEGEAVAKKVLKELDAQKKKVLSDGEKELNKKARSNKYSPLEGKALFDGYDKYLRSKGVIPRYTQ